MFRSIRQASRHHLGIQATPATAPATPDPRRVAALIEHLNQVADHTTHRLLTHPHRTLVLNMLTAYGWDILDDDPASPQHLPMAAFRTRLLAAMVYEAEGETVAIPLFDDLITELATFIPQAPSCPAA